MSRHQLKTIFNPKENDALTTFRFTDESGFNIKSLDDVNFNLSDPRLVGSDEYRTLTIEAWVYRTSRDPDVSGWLKIHLVGDAGNNPGRIKSGFSRCGCATFSAIDRDLNH